MDNEEVARWFSLGWFAFVTRTAEGCVCNALLCLMLLGPLTGLGQGWTLRGRVLADTTSRGVAGAAVVSAASKAATLTDSAGYFVLPIL